MATEEEDYSGLHWRSFEWLVHHTAHPIMDFTDRHGPSHEQIVSLHENLVSFTRDLKPDQDVEKTILEGTVKKVNGIFSDYMGSCKGGSATIIERGSTYHKMKARIELAKGHRISAISQWLEAAGYSSLIIPAGIGFMGYGGLGFLWCGPPEIATMTYNALSSAEKRKIISERIRTYRKERQARQTLKREASSRFYSLVDNKI
jgi:hypothetical protein